jgi:hypothetical protein
VLKKRNSGVQHRHCQATYDSDCEVSLSRLRPFGDTSLFAGGQEISTTHTHFGTFARHTKPDTEANLAKEPEFYRRSTTIPSVWLPLHPVKTLIAYILAFYILFSAVVPCSIIDNCEEEEHTEQTSNTDHKKDCSNCSPFSICSSASGFTINSVSTFLEPVEFYNSPSYSEYNFSSKSEYYSSLFQPPRVG